MHSPAANFDICPGVAHHVTQRGNNRQPVFYSDDDRRLYLDLLTGYTLRHSTQVLGYCLMTNHVHLVVVPWDWAWSSARAHSREGDGDTVLEANGGSHLASWDYGGWTERLLAGMSDADTGAVR